MEEPLTADEDWMNRIISVNIPGNSIGVNGLIRINFRYMGKEGFRICLAFGMSAKTQRRNRMQKNSKSN